MNIIMDILRVVLIGLAVVWMMGIAFMMASIARLLFCTFILRTSPFNSTALHDCVEKLKPLRKFLLRVWIAALMVGLLLIGVAFLQEAFFKGAK